MSPPPDDESSCPICKGKQWTYEYNGDEMLSVPCVCLAKQQLRGFLGPEIASANPVKSDLYKPQLNSDTGKLEGDRTTENLFLKGNWSTICSHLHWALWGKRRFSKNNFFFKIITDEKLLPVWLGNEAYNRRAAKVRDDIETFNSLADLVSDPTLLIIRLGYLGYTNRAAPGVLLQALGIREALYKPTWIVEGSNYFGEGHFSYSAEVGMYIEDNFDVVDLGGASKVEERLWAALKVDEAPQEKASVPEETDTVAMGPGIDTPKNFDEDGSAREPRFKYPQRKKKWRKPGDGSGGGAGGLGDMF